MNAPVALRAIVAVVVAADSRVGQLAHAIDDMTAHLPPAQEPRACPLCSTLSWPCARFSDAAHRLHDAGIALDVLVPHDLHQRLWPPTQQPVQGSHPHARLTEEPHDG